MKESVRLFDPSRLTCLATDWSVNGVCFFLMQKYCNCNAKTPACCPNGWKLCLVGSRFTHPAEGRNAPLQGDALAVLYALIVAKDYKPLLQILNDRSLTDSGNRCLLNRKEKTLCYRFTVVHVPEKRTLDRMQHHVILLGSLRDYSYLARQLMPTHQSAKTYLVMMPCPFYSSIQTTSTQLMTTPLLSQQLVP